MEIRIHNHRVARMVAIGGFFLAVCLFYVIRLGMLNLRGEHIAGHRQDGTTKRTVIVQAVRGQIYDRNGKALVTNAYTYRLTMDYSVMPADELSRNAAILRTWTVLNECGEGALFCTHQYPLAGAYPELVYTAEAVDTESEMHSTLVGFLTDSGLRASAIKRLRSDGMSAKEAEAAFDAAPLQYVDVQRLVDYFADEYLLGSVSAETGERLYTDGEIDRLLRVLWGMEVTGFSRANDYIMAEGVSMDTITHAKEQGIPGVSFSMTVERVYMYPGYASHILGQTGPIYAEDWPAYKDKGYNMNALVGISGCEAAFEDYLHGQDGVKVIVEDADGNVVNEYMKSEPVAGKDVYLTIDIDLQIAAEDGLRENVQYVRESLGRDECKAGALTAVDPDTGEVLALASYPSYDLTTFGQDYSDLVADDALPLYNRALSGLYAPGSTFKPGVTAAALTDGVIDTDTHIECTGTYTYYQSYQPHCWIYNSVSSPVRQHGWLCAADALEVSCNCFYYETGRLLGIERMNHYCRIYGLGQSTGIELGESEGILAGPDWREANRQKAWQATDTIAAAIGQSDNAFTPLQLSVYISTLVNGGTRYRAHLLSRVRDFAARTDIAVTTPEVVDAFPLQDTYRREIIEGMERVITSSASITRYMRNVPVTVAGKTGTAQVGGNSTDNGLFVCCAPSQDPEIVVTAVIERSGGGSYAALAAARVLEAYYE